MERVQGRRGRRGTGRASRPRTTTERVTALDEPVLVRRTGAAGTQVEQPSPAVSVRIPGQVDHPGQLPWVHALRSRSAWSTCDATHAHQPQGSRPPRSGTGRHQRPATRVGSTLTPCATSAELASDRVDRGVLAADLLDRPPARPRRQHHPGCGDLFVLLHERPDLAGGSGQSQRRLRQMRRTGLPNAGASTWCTSIRP